MAYQEDIIVIKTQERITTSILDYMLNILMITEILPEDLVQGKSFSPNGYEEYGSIDAVGEKFKVTSTIYKKASNLFAQKYNNGVNQSNMKKLVIVKKDEEDKSYLDCLNRIGYKNCYYTLCNSNADANALSVNDWVSNRRKIQLYDAGDDEMKNSEATNDIASVLKAKNAGRTGVFYHEVETESLSGALMAILASSPVGTKSASYKTPSGITVDNLTDTEEETLRAKNANFFTYYIASSGDYGTRQLTSDNGIMANGDDIQKVICVDRTVLELQAGLMDAIVQDLPYDDNGGTVIYDAVNSVFSQLKREGVIAQDSIDPETNEVIKGYTIYVLTRAETKKYYPEYFAKKSWIVDTTVEFALTGKRVHLTLAY